MAMLDPAGADRAAGRARRRARGAPAPPSRCCGCNWLGGTAGWLWLVVVMVPIYWIVITSFKTQSNYYATNPLAPPAEPTLENYRLVIESDFARYFVNSVIVTVGAVAAGGADLVHGGVRDRPRRRGQPVPARRSTACS